MTRTAQLTIALTLACVAILLLGYAAYEARAKIETLEADLAWSQDLFATANEDAREFYRILESEETRESLQKIVETEARGVRQILVDYFAELLDGTLSEFPHGYYVRDGLNKLVTLDDQSDRVAARDAIYIAVFGTTEPDVDAADFLAPPTLENLSGLIAAVGGIGSGLTSLFLFLVGGNRRKIEEEMLTIELDMKRVELAQARYTAREALQNKDAT